MAGRYRVDGHWSITGPGCSVGPQLSKSIVLWSGIRLSIMLCSDFDDPLNADTVNDASFTLPPSLINFCFSV